MHYSCGHPANLSKISGKISIDSDVQLLILDQSVSSVPCYMCLKDLYEQNPNHTDPGFRAWHKSTSYTSKAYAHLLRHIAIVSGMVGINRDNIYPRYWIEVVWGIQNDYQEDPNKPTLSNIINEKNRKRLEEQQDAALDGLFGGLI